MQTYIITIKHDAGTAKIRTAATSISAAVNQVLTAERAPERAITNIKIIQKPWHPEN